MVALLVALSLKLISVLPFSALPQSAAEYILLFGQVRLSSPNEFNNGFVSSLWFYFLEFLAFLLKQTSNPQSQSPYALPFYSSSLPPASFSSSPHHSQSIADHRPHGLVPRQIVLSMVDAPSIIHRAKLPSGNLAQLSSGPGFVSIEMEFWSSMCPKPGSALPFHVVCFAFCSSLAGCLHWLGQGFGLGAGLHNPDLEAPRREDEGPVRVFH